LEAELNRKGGFRRKVREEREKRKEEREKKKEKR